eukprot:scaffold1225_cov164-Amphora_coffeaeformis.AAC.6
MDTTCVLCLFLFGVGGAIKFRQGTRVRSFEERRLLDIVVTAVAVLLFQKGDQKCMQTMTKRSRMRRYRHFGFGVAAYINE